MSDEETLRTALKNIAAEAWGDREQPILLSNVTPKLNVLIADVDYKTLLAGRSLKNFVKDTGEQGGYRLVEHPTLKSKVGLVPRDALFEFEPQEDPRGARAVPQETRKNEAAILAFLRSLSRLSSEDIDKLVIPVSVIVKLLK